MKDIEQEKQKLRDQYLALDNLGVILNHIQRYQKILLMQKNLNDTEKLWLLAYDALDLKLRPGSEEAMIEVAAFFPLMESFIPDNIK